ncbi:hypothetical protein [Streptomyces sp. NPDC048603]|uniref:hypothetical protein n=1 Tax=Streptomyces sp. NPDC048603 TaxID=3365577 RepID=UPI003720789A
MSHTSLADDTELLPWGEVTAAFWQHPAEPAPTPPGTPEPSQEPGTLTTAEPSLAAPKAPESPVAEVESDFPDVQGDESEAVPQEYSGRIAGITEVMASPDDRDRLAWAAAEAEQLDRELAERFGEAHAHTINLRELRGWLALVSGQPATAARWYLHTTGLHSAAYGPTHPLTHSSAMRALHSWRQIRDDEQVLGLASELEVMLGKVTGEDSRPVEFVRTRAARRRAERG